MPSTTNSIESIHGHLNEATPRNNCFWPSLHRIIMAINFQIHRFNDKLHHNFNKFVRDIKRKIFHNPSISEECTFYETTINKCQCGETILYSSMYRRDIPCSHRLFLGATTKKQLSELILDIINDWTPQKRNGKHYNQNNCSKKYKKAYSFSSQRRH